MKLRRMILPVVLLVALGVAVGAQDNRALTAYQERFRDSNHETKLQILQNADAIAVEDLGPLYVQALEYGLSNASQATTDALLQQIVIYAAQKAAEGSYEPAAGTLWSVFTEFQDSMTRIVVLDAMGQVGVGNPELILDLNGWVQAQTNLYRSGIVPDRQVMEAAVVTLGSLGDVSSFPILLDAQLAQMSDLITEAARTSMKSLAGDYPDLAVATINRRTISNQLEALDFFLDDPDLSDDERARIATGVLREAVRLVVRDVNEQQALRQIRFRATRELMDIPYEPAADSLIRHFNLAFRSYDQGIVAKTWVLESIAALGNTGSDAAAARLLQFLNLLNTYTANSRPYDTQLTLAVVTNLERLGSMEAYDALLYVTMLDYPQTVKDAARSALDAVSR